MMIREFASPGLPSVDAFWISEGMGSARILPDGCADIIFDLDNARAAAVGTMTRPLVVESTGRQIGVRFKPGYAGLFLDAPLDEFTDTVLPQRDLAILASRVCEARSTQVRLSLIAEALRRDVAPDTRVTQSIDAIVKTGGRRSVKDICDDAGVSRQHLARLFARHVGINPKMFARIVRFRRALRLARTQRWSDLAQELGYFDHSHLIAEFREFAGENPVPFFQAR